MVGCWDIWGPGHILPPVPHCWRGCLSSSFDTLKRWLYLVFCYRRLPLGYSVIIKQKALRDQNSKYDVKRCWTAWNLTFSHRFGTIFSRPKTADRDASFAMVKTAYFELIRTKKRTSNRKKPPEANKKPEPNAVSRHQNEVSRHQRSIQGHSGA